MRSWLTDIAVIAVVLTFCLRVSERSAKDRWKRRFCAIGSPLIEPPAYRVLFVLVVVGVLLVATQPEAAFVLPVLDSVGLDIVTILVALELRHYVVSVARLVGAPAVVAVCRRGPAQIVTRYRDVMRTNPVLWLYSCLWLLIWFRTFMGTSVSPRGQI
jgi:hypothetical protein